MTSSALSIFDMGFSYDVDGPGQRLVVYLKGCNLCCPWCAAPESIASAPQVLFYPDRVESPARACAACPFGAVTEDQGTLQRCITHCERCETFACSASGQRAFELVGKTSAVEAIIAQAQRYRSYFGTQGGVTIGGGEPTCQFTAVTELLTELATAGLRTAMETNGTHPDLPALYELLDLLLIDLKHPEKLACAGLTPDLVAVILANIRRRHESGREMRVRIPLAPGYNADDATLHRFGAVLAAAGRPLVEILPFHRRGEVKWHALGKLMPAAASEEPSDALIHHAEDILSGYGIQIY
jgi:pyruvate formate lyase activating enzyme